MARGGSHGTAERSGGGSNTYWRRGLTRFAQLHRSGGAPAVLRWVLGGTVYRRGILLARDLADVVQQPTDLPIRFARLEERDIPAYLELLPGSERSVRRRLEVGDVGYGGWLEARLVTVGWARPGRAGIPELGLVLELEPDEVYTYGSFTAPELRGNNLASARASAMLRALASMGYRRAVSYVVPEDRAALGPAGKNDFRHIGWIGFVGVRPLRVAFVKEHGHAVQLRWRRRPIRLAGRSASGSGTARLLGAGTLLAACVELVPT